METTTTIEASPTLWQIFITWLTTGLQSFGGGSSTFYLIHQACIANGWLDEVQFLRAWALVQVSPGINLLKLTVLIGYQLRGWGGALVAAGGLILPSALVTVLMTAGFALVRSRPEIQAGMRGLLPATIGLSLSMAAQMIQPLLGQARREGSASLAGHLSLLAGAALLFAAAGLSPVVVLLLSGAVMAAFLPGIRRSIASRGREAAR